MREATVKEIEARLKGNTPRGNSSLTTTRGFSPEIAKLFGSRDIAIFLNQMKFRWESSGRKEFYKFVEPSPNSSHYRDGDSWCEELVMSRYEFRKCRDAVSTRAYSKKEAMEILKDEESLGSLVVYYICKSNNNITYWYFNEKLYNRLFGLVVEENYTKEDDTETKAERQSINLGRKEKNQPLYTENTKEYNIMEKNENFDELFDSSSTKEIKRKVSETKRTKTREKAAKPTKKLTQQQLDIIREKKYGKAMPLDFTLKSSIIDEVVEQGFDYDDVITEARLFMHHYKNEHQEKTCLDWDARFRDFWMPNSVKFKKAKTKFKKEQTSNANEERLRGLQRVAEGSVFERVGTTDLTELGESLRDYYETVYGGFDS